MMEMKAVAIGALSVGTALVFVVPVCAQNAGQTLPPKLGQPPTPQTQGQQPRLRVLMSPSVASPMLLLPESGTGVGSSGLSPGGAASDQPAPQSGSSNLFPKPAVAPGDSNSTNSSPQSVPATEAKGSSSTAHSSYNPRSFLKAMLELRLTANTCDKYLPKSPDDATKQIVDFFTGLRRPAPTGTLKGLGSSLDMLIRSQAASICQDRMGKAIAIYQTEAGTYDEKKPQAWPVAPVIEATNWCSTPNCIEVK